MTSPPGDRMEGPLPLSPERAWYVACESSALRRGPMGVTVLERPIVLFRTADGAAQALVDRCPHRNVPLSLGKMRGDQLECAYHGWRFTGDGDCQFVPGLVEQRPSPARCAVPHAVREQDGVVWVWARPDDTPDREPFRFPHLDDRRYTTLRQGVEAEASLLDVAENAMDVPHTAYLHGGLFRNANGPRNDIEVILKRWPDRVEAEYLGEPRPPGIIAKVLAPRGGTVEHVDRFLLPSIVQVEYRLGDATHWCATAALTPVTPRRTRLYAFLSFRLPLPGWLVTPVLRPLAMKVYTQDADMLREQTRNVG
ncbi:MAG: aromatic ring-hydroxylating dioxygenase subunit alpha, partial [Gemmatimonadetes bacterium]|nr:aromatic ring-hydroxylating dioxygenase subunit alpha [Gemmatimonadota bacterium]